MNSVATGSVHLQSAIRRFPHSYCGFALTFGRMGWQTNFRVFVYIGTASPCLEIILADQLNKLSAGNIT
jgi:hypothetical protein